MQKISLMALSVLMLAPAAAAAQDIRDVKPPVGYPFNYLPLLAAVLLALAVIGIWRGMDILKRLRAAFQKPVPAKKPWETALERLEALEKEALPQKGLVEEFYIKLSSIVRYYIADRFAIHAPEMTTEEFLSMMLYLPDLTWEHKQSLRRFLEKSDLIKFAREKESPVDMQVSFNLTKGFIQETIPETPPIEEKLRQG